MSLIGQYGAVVEDLAGYPLDQLRTQFIANMQAAVAVALPPAIAIPAAQPIAGPMRLKFEQVVTLFNDTIQMRDRLQSDTRSRPEAILAAWQAHGQAATAQADELIAAIDQKSTALIDALRGAALPANPDPAAVANARQEVVMTLRQADHPFSALLDLVGQGSDLAAAAASNWGRLAFQEVAGGQLDDSQWTTVQDAAIQAAQRSDDPAKQRAAAALQTVLTARRQPEAGQPAPSAPALAEAQSLAAFLCGVVKQAVAQGVVVA